MAVLDAFLAANGTDDHPLFRRYGAPRWVPVEAMRTLSFHSVRRTIDPQSHILRIDG
jgi:hypothetical protein